MSKKKHTPVSVSTPLTTVTVSAKKPTFEELVLQRIEAAKAKAYSSSSSSSSSAIGPKIYKTHAGQEYILEQRVHLPSSHKGGRSRRRRA